MISKCRKCGTEWDAPVLACPNCNQDRYDAAAPSQESAPSPPAVAAPESARLAELIALAEDYGEQQYAIINFLHDPEVAALLRSQSGCVSVPSKDKQ